MGRFLAQVAAASDRDDYQTGRARSGRGVSTARRHLSPKPNYRVGVALAPGTTLTTAAGVPAHRRLDATEDMPSGCDQESESASAHGSRPSRSPGAPELIWAVAQRGHLGFELLLDPGGHRGLAEVAPVLRVPLDLVVEMA